MTTNAAKSDTLDLTLAPEERPAAPPSGRPRTQLRRIWPGLRFRIGGSLGEATTAPAVPVLETGEEDDRPARPQRHKKSWREQRWERRRRRIWFEEVLAWILVPIIVISAYWGVKSGLGALGTTPSALIAGIKTAISSRGGGL